MPKIIKNLNDRIFNVAWQLFTSKGYDNVDIKAIAKECNIAVGTFYNYFGTKEKLFLKVLEKSWDSTFIKLNNLIDISKDTQYKTDKFIEILYYDIKERRGLGAEILSGEVRKIKSEIGKDIITKRLLDFIKDTKIETFEKNSIEESRVLLSMILSNIVLLINLRGNFDNKNIKFLHEIVENF